MADERKSFGARLRTLREQAELSQEELAERAGLSSHAVSALERGTRTRPYPHTVRALADALGLEGEARSGLISSVPARTARPAASVGTGHGIPVPPTRLIGREDDLGRVVELLDHHRMVTLAGPGGVGKTRLSLAVARTVQDRFADGVVYVELATLRDPHAVVPAVLDAVGVTAPAESPVAALIGWAAGRELLLILDNAEQVAAAAPQVAELVAGIPGLALLVTSRAPLRLRAEHEFAVEPLALPTAGTAESPAVRLLLERAADVSAGWGTAPGDEAAVAAVCVRLAGIPLALELAAARCRLLAPDALLERLDQVLQVDGADRPERHRTMRATLDWSYGLLTAEEQALLRLLAVFLGGFRLDDVEGVARRAGLDGDVLTLLESLAEQSLVTVEPAAAGVRRHRLLEPVAQYARSRLVEAGEEKDAARAHAEHFLALAEELSPRYRDGGQVVALARVDADHLNLTTAVEALLAAGDGQAAGRLCWALWMYWWLRGHHVLGRRLSEAALELGQVGVVRGQAELAAATSCFAMDEVPAARAHWESARAHADGDRAALANAVAGIGLADLADGRLAEARDCFTEAREAAEGAGEYGAWTTALSWVWSGTVSLLLGDPERAVQEISEGLASARQRGDRLSTYIALYNLSQVELARGRFVAAGEHLDEGTRLSRETSDHANLAYLLEARAVLEAQQGAHARVPLLIGASQSIREQLGSFGYGYYRPDPQAIADAAEEARAHLGGDRYDDALDVGRGLDPLRAAALSLGEPAPA